ncbi:pol, partial [Symbiodinium microadriaticum]
VDQARAQVGVHRYLPEVSGVRIKWALAYLKEDGSMTTSEGSRPSIETVSVKEVITKVDLNRDGVLAASSARKLDKAGYLLQERTAFGCSERERLRRLGPRGCSLSRPCVGGRAFSPCLRRAAFGKNVGETHLPKECLDILEVSWGEPVLSRAARLKGYSVGPAIVHGGKAYSVQWDLIEGTHVAAVVGALDLLKPRLLVVTLLGKGVPHCLYQFVVDRAVQRREYLAVCFTSEDGEWKPWAFEGWRRCFGTLSEPTFPWGFVRADNCQFVGAVGRSSPLAEKSCFWLSDFSLSAAGLRCGKPDALGNVPHDHGKSKVTSYNLQGAAVRAALPNIGLRGASHSIPEGVRSLPAAAGPAPAPPQPVPEMPLPDVKSGKDISPAERAKLDKEVEAYAQVYALAGEKVSEDPRRTEAYKDLVWEGLKIEPGPT